MPLVTNKRTGKSYPVTSEGLAKIKANPLTRRLFTYQDVQEPQEVTELKTKAARKRNRNTEK